MSIWLNLVLAVALGTCWGALVALYVDARLRRRRLRARRDAWAVQQAELQARSERWRRRLGLEESELG